MVKGTAPKEGDMEVVKGRYIGGGPTHFNILSNNFFNKLKIKIKKTFKKLRKV